MTSIDKDFRFMATNDLMTELQNDSIKLDDDSERKVKKILSSNNPIRIRICSIKKKNILRLLKLYSNCWRIKMEVD
jgi:hypothetical protein